jgi:hypothetical protein
MVDVLADKLYKFDVGDLVRLVEDPNLEVGCGLITDIKNSLDDVYDLEYLRLKIRNLKEILHPEDDDIFPSKPQILVLWTGKNITAHSIWMYPSELTIVQKVIKQTK